jgi:hypothetical protein
MYIYLGDVLCTGLVSYCLLHIFDINTTAMFTNTN